MTKQTKRVVLNLSLEQAKALLNLLSNEQSEIARKICIRMNKTITKHEAVMPEVA
jgi:hypothetical protein